MFERISQSLLFAQAILFPQVEAHLGPLTGEELKLTQLLESLHIEDYVRDLPLGDPGQQPTSRKILARAFVAKAALDISTTADLIARLQGSPNLRQVCGWKASAPVPSAATFFRAFQEFTEQELAEKVHATIIQDAYADQVIGHISRDSTEIEAREKAGAKPKPVLPAEPVPAKKRGRPKKGEVRPAPEPTRLERQQTQTLEEMLGELPQACDWGRKKNSKGKVHDFKGYKLHVDVADGGVPISVLLTSASVHDSQGALPLMHLTSAKVLYFYDVMDAAYDAGVIRTVSRGLDHVPIIDPNQRRGEKIPLDPAKKERFKIRTTVERSFSRLKDEFGAREIWVKGPAKVLTHLMFGVLVLTVDALFRLAG